MPELKDEVVEFLNEREDDSNILGKAMQLTTSDGNRTLILCIDEMAPARTLRTLQVSHYEIRIDLSTESLTFCAENGRRSSFINPQVDERGRWCTSDTISFCGITAQNYLAICLLFRIVSVAACSCHCPKENGSRSRSYIIFFLILWKSHKVFQALMTVGRSVGVYDLSEECGRSFRLEVGQDI